jgi:hypothetical protein
MPSIVYERRNEFGVLEDATTVTLSDSGATYGIKVNSSGAVAVAAGTAVVNSSEGVYTYDTSALSVGNYTVSWKIVDAAGTRYLISTFSIDSIAFGYDGVTLAEIERALGPKVGPYLRREVVSGSASTMVITNLQSSISAHSDIVDLYVLRRGITSTGAFVTGLSTDDRIRLVASLDTDAGSVAPDRNWATSPALGEMVEFHHLHPDDEMRFAVREGLKRCYLEDIATVTVETADNDHDLTALLPWLTSPKQVREMRDSYGLKVWSRVYGVGGHVWVNMGSASTFQVVALRPAYSDVNEAVSLLGPDDDDDIIRVPLDYAVASAHVQAWEHFPSRLIDAARQGYQLTRQQAAQRFTKARQRYVQQRRKFPLLPYNPNVPSGWGPLL